MDEQPQAPSGAPAGRRTLTWGDLTSALALVIAVFALAVSLFEANTQRIQQRASVWPYVELSEGFSAEGYRLTVENKGVGPARVERFEILLDGEAFTDLDRLIVAAVGPESAFSYDVYRTNPVDGAVLSAGERRNVFSAPWDGRTRAFATVFSNRGDLELCYCSIFDECWRGALKGDGAPAPVRRCAGG